MTNHWGGCNGQTVCEIDYRLGEKNQRLKKMKRILNGDVFYISQSNFARNAIFFAFFVIEWRKIYVIILYINYNTLYKYYLGVNYEKKTDGDFFRGLCFHFNGSFGFTYDFSSIRGKRRNASVA
jgi:hypothetical protein